MVLFGLVWFGLAWFGLAWFVVHLCMLFVLLLVVYAKVDEVGGSGFVSEIGSGTMDLDGGDAVVGIRESIRVQGIVDSGVSLVPSQYIQPLPNRPSTNSHDGDYCDRKSIPIIDLLGFDSAHIDSIKAAIRSACGEWGAFQVINHGVPTELLEEMRRVGLSFFNEGTMADKLTYACDPNSFASEGYGTQMLVSNQTDESPSSSVLDWRDYFDHHTLPLSRRNPSRWPHFPSNYRETVAQYGDRMKVLAQQVLAVISESLGLSSSLIEDTVTAGEDFYQNITFSYYPPCPQPDLTLGLQPHSDIGVLTLLIQDDVGGLQVLDKNKNWVTVQPLSTDAIVVILADQLEIISNGKCRSCEHRAVTNARKARLSVAAFHDPAKGVKISPASELVSESSPPRYRDIVYGEYLSSWYTKGPEGKRQLDALRLN